MVKICWTEQAIKNLKNIYDYIAVNSKVYAEQSTKRIVRATENIERFPRMGRVVPELEELGLREVLFQNYRIVYRLTSDEKFVEILAVVHASRDLLKLAHTEWELQ